MNRLPADDDLTAEERLSAYLDGELSAEQEELVERELAEDPQKRQLLDDLRLLKGSFRLLPHHTLPDDFAQQVLQQAEREVHRDGAARRASSGGNADPGWSTQAKHWVANRAWSRSLGWSAAAVIVAVVLIVMQNAPQWFGTEVAQAPIEPGPAEQNEGVELLGGDEVAAAPSKPDRVKGDGATSPRKETLPENEVAIVPRGAPERETLVKREPLRNLIIVNVELPSQADAAKFEESLARYKIRFTPSDPAAVARAAQHQPQKPGNVQDAPVAVPAGTELVFVEAVQLQLNAAVTDLRRKYEVSYGIPQNMPLPGSNLRTTLKVDDPLQAQADRDARRRAARAALAADMIKQLSPEQLAQLKEGHARKIVLPSAITTARQLREELARQIPADAIQRAYQVASGDNPDKAVHALFILRVMPLR